MSITVADAAHIARLARLALTERELAKLTAQLNDILRHVEELRAVDVRDVAPFASAADRVAGPREDSPGADPLHSPPAAIAPAWLDGFFTVPKLYGGAEERSEAE